MKFEVILSPIAMDDLEDIYVHGVNTFGERQADIYAQKIHSVFERLSKMPTMGHARKDIVCNT